VTLRVTKTKRSARRARRIAMTIFLFAFVGWLGFCAHLGLSAKAHLLKAQANLRTLTSGDSSLKSLVDGDQSLLLQAQAELSMARQDLNSPALGIASPLPFVGTQVRSARALTTTAKGLVDAAMLASTDLTPQRRKGISRIELLDRVAVATQRLAVAVNGSSLGPSSGLITPLADARNEMSRQLASIKTPIDRTNAAIPGLRQMLVGPTHFLLVAANNAQMASGSGLPLAVATLDIADGQMQVGPFEWSASIDVPAGSVALPSELADLWAFATPQDTIRRAIVTPRFPVSARLMSDQYRAATGRTVDGVMLIDIVGLQKLVAAAGTSSSIPADQLIAELMNGQYLKVDYGDPDGIVERKERLGDIARSAVSTLLDPETNPVGLSSALSAAISGRHLLLWSSAPIVQNAFVSLDADGDLGDTSVAVNLQNEASNKLDWFVRVGAKMTASDAANGDRNMTVEVDITNNVPDGQPAYVAGPSLRILSYGDYVGYLTINVPSAATNLHVGDKSPLIVAGSDGPTSTIGQLVSIKRNAATKVTFLFTLPASLTTLSVEPSARYPAVSWTMTNDTWTDERAHTVFLTTADGPRRPS
jgi:Protein of unknown function (DUF4012)